VELPSARPTTAPSRATLASRGFQLDAAERADCAIVEGGTVRCWSERSPPADIAGLADVESLAATDHVTCARTRADAVRCWGRGSGSSSLQGMGDRIGSFHGLPDDVEALSTGGERICARRRGALWCSPEAAPRWVAQPGAVASTQGGPFDCTLDARGAIACAIGPGENDETRLGPVTLPGKHVSLALLGWGVHGDGAVELCALDAAGQVRCYHGRASLARAEGRTIPLPRAAVQLGAGMHHACALLDDGSVQCWDGAVGNHGVPSAVRGLPEAAIEIAVGDRHACARLVSGKVACFGGAYDVAGASTPPRVVLGG
jgi:hypothetical protein